MKKLIKHLPGLLLALALVLFFASGNGMEVSAAADVCPCCNTPISSISWTTVSGSTSFTTGHYKLTGAVTLSAEKTISANQTVTIDLCGNTLTAASGARCFYVAGTLNIIDSGANGAIAGGNVANADDSSSSYATRGGNILVTSKGTLNIYGGTVTGGQAKRGGNISGEGQIYLRGGAVTNGTATDDYGHNIYVQQSTGILNISGGSVGEASNGGVSAYAMYATIDISGGTIQGNVKVLGTSNKYSMLFVSGGTINGNVTALGAVAANTAPIVSISGGVLNGTTTITGAKTFSLSGAPVINELDLSAGVLIAFGPLSQNASIAELSAIGVFTAPLNNAEAYLAWLANTTTPRAVVEEGSRLVMENGTVIDSDTDGNISWTLTNDGVLTISGNGDMENYRYEKFGNWVYSNTPWKNYLEQIKLVEIESDVTAIGDNAFAGCGSLTAVTLPNSVTSISSSAFTDAAMGIVLFNGTASQWAEKTGLTDNINNACVKILGGEAMPAGNISYTISDAGVLIITGTGAMPNYYYDSELTSLLGTPWKDRAAEITSVVISDGITAIGSWAFYDLVNLTSVTIPESVTTIGNNAFRGCGSLTEITIPESVETIRQGAFTQTGLEIVVYDGTVAQWGAITVENFNEPLVNADINCDGLRVESVTIKTNPTDTVYIAGQALDPTGLVVTVTYAGGTTADITEGYQLTYDFSTAGTKTVTVTYGGKTATFQVVVGILGDVDGNGSVTKNDAVYVLWYLEGKADLPYEEFADFDGNGVVTKNDAVYILWYVSGKIAP